MKSVTFENLKKQNYTMKESLRALKTNIQFCGDDICTIVVTSAMPNEGKSTVTMDLARSFSHCLSAVRQKTRGRSLALSHLPGEESGARLSNAAAGGGK